jgi:hypothetical protein
LIAIHTDKLQNSRRKRRAQAGLDGNRRTICKDKQTFSDGQERSRERDIRRTFENKGQRRSSDDFNNATEGGPACGLVFNADIHLCVSDVILMKGGAEKREKGKKEEINQRKEERKANLSV